MLPSWSKVEYYAGNSFGQIPIQVSIQISFNLWNSVHLYYCTIPLLLCNGVLSVLWVKYLKKKVYSKILFPNHCLLRQQKDAINRCHFTCEPKLKIIIAI